MAICGLDQRVEEPLAILMSGAYSITSIEKGSPGMKNCFLGKLISFFFFLEIKPNLISWVQSVTGCQKKRMKREDLAQKQRTLLSGHCQEQREVPKLILRSTVLFANII